MTIPSSQEKVFLQALSMLTLAPDQACEVYSQLSRLSEQEFSGLTSLADSNHVLLRALTPLQNVAGQCGDGAFVARCQTRIDQERRRITNAVQHLFLITRALEASGCPTTVMKSLDHWPDLGNDLDLYTTAGAKPVSEVMTTRFRARIEPRSWGDRLANKWSFALAGLPEAVDVHAQRLGLTGEHVTMAERLVSRRVQKSVLGFDFEVPAPEERIVITTLQRMYRHLYFRICDIVNIAALVESGAVDFVELHRAASLGGIWKGVCTLLRIVSDYVLQYRGTPVALPPEVLADALFGGEKVHLKSRFIRMPIARGAELYTVQVTTAALRGDVAATFRLSLLPYLASAAAISDKLIGSNKGIW